MYNIIKYVTKDDKHINEFAPFVKVRRMTHITVRSDMIDSERSDIFDKAISKVMNIAGVDEVYHIRVSISVVDAIQCKTVDIEPVEVYCILTGVKEKYEKFNILRTNKHVVDSLVNSKVKDVSSGVTVADAMEMMGLSTEDSSEYLDREGNYDYPDLIGRWSSLFSQENK